MIPCLYDSYETAYTTNGIGKLADCVSCLVTEKRNGSYELKLTYPSDGIHADGLTEGNIILAQPADRSQAQPFRIYKVTSPLTGRVEVQARHISYQLNYIAVSPFSGSGCEGALAGLKAHASSGCPFSFVTDIQSSAAFTLSEPASLRNCLGGMDGSVLDTFGGEYEWDRYAVRLHKKRGADRNVRIVYGKNLVDFKMEKSIENVITGIHPYWKSSEGTVVAELPEKVVLTEREEDPPFERVTVLDCSSEFQEQPTAEQLRSCAKTYLKTTTLTEPDIDITIDFAQLWQTPGYEDIAEAERVSLCDTVHVYISKLGIEVASKVTETVYDTLLERYQSVTLSNSLVSSRNSSLTASLGSIRSEASNAYQIAANVEMQSQTDYGKAVENQHVANVLAAGLLGLHYSEGTDSSGKAVRYACNAEQLSDSTYAWKNSGDGFYVSTDGGETWEYGWTDDGEAVLNAMNMVKLLGDQITGGEIDTALVKLLGNGNFYWNGEFILLKDPKDSKRQLRIGEYGDESLGIAYSSDGGETWEEAVGFGGIRLSTENWEQLEESYGTAKKLSEEVMEGLDLRYAAKIAIAEEKPEKAAEDMLWVDKSTDPIRLKIYDGTEWKTVGYEPEEKTTEPDESTEPETPTEPDTVDTDTDDSSTDSTGSEESTGSTDNTDTEGGDS